MSPNVARRNAVLALVFVIALWALCHPYPGLVSDSAVYIGRIVADLDPSGVGRDLMFVNDGQSQFSIFPRLARPLVANLGPSRASLVIAAVAGLTWSLALVALAHGLATGRVAWAMAIVVALLPVAYGQPGIFSFGETMALPRPFAEAAVMASLAALLRKRFGLAIGFLCLAFLFHPIMALAGAGVTAIFLSWDLYWGPSRVSCGEERIRSRRRIAMLTVIALVIPMALLLAWLGVPLLNRLLIVADPHWESMFVERSPHLFPTLWEEGAYAPLLMQAATLIIAADLAPSTQRRVFASVLIAGLLGLMSAAILSDTFHILLAIQVQFWRMVWLTGVVSGCGLAFCAAHQWNGGNARRISLAFLLLGWFFPPSVLITAAIACLALLFHFGSFRNDPAIKNAHVIAALVGAVALGFWFDGSVVAGYIEHLRTKPDHDLTGLIDPLRNNIHTLPLCLLTGVWLLASPRRGWSITSAQAVVGGGVVTLLLGAVFMLWDQRRSDAPYFEVLHRPSAFDEMAASRSPEVLWIDGRAEGWFTLGHPQYLSAQQAVSIVFSRPLAMEWRRRAELLVSLGLEKKAIFKPADRAADHDRLNVTQAAIDMFCGRSDAPGIIVLPIEKDAVPPRLSGLKVWHVPVPRYILERHAQDEWHIISDYGLVPCGAPKTATVHEAGL